MTSSLIDTSVWIRHLRGEFAITERLADTVSRRGSLASCGPTAMELLAGIKERNVHLIDCLIASIALRQEDVVVAHCVADFDRLAQVTQLRAERWDVPA